jgi:hypothetical protein
MRPKDSLETLLQKMLLAGWISSTGTIEKSGSRIRGILWTDSGLERSVAVAVILKELGDLTDGEWKSFRRIIADHSKD